MSQGEHERRIAIHGIDALQLLGHEDRHLKTVTKKFAARVTVRGNAIIIKGDPAEVKQLEQVFTELIIMINRNGELRDAEVETVVSLIKQGESHTDEPLAANDQRPAVAYTKNSVIRPKTAGQTEFYHASTKNDIVFAIGPAGTGKTFLAVAIAVAHLRDRQMERIVLARPAVEAGESLGFLPGDFKEKIDPYLRPLYDALHDMIPADKLKKYLENQIIEIVPLAYMRGRTLNNAFVILDEAQNTTPSQMKMFLTRLGINAKAIINGDITQIDLPDTTESGLVQCREILTNVEGIAFVYLTEQDVVRHRLVRDIIRAYDQFKNPA